MSSKAPFKLDREFVAFLLLVIGILPALLILCFIPELLPPTKILAVDWMLVCTVLSFAVGIL